MQALKRACQVAKRIIQERTGETVDGDGQTALATLIGKSQGHVGMWLKRQKVPAEVCMLIQLATNGEVTAAQLRPDVFGVGSEAEGGGPTVRTATFPEVTTPKGKAA